MKNTYGIDETIKSITGFYFGDPCYVMSKEDYDELIDQMFVDSIEYGRVGKFTVNGHEFIVDNTAYGDGVYSGWNGSYGVDAGMLGVIPLELVKKDPTNMGWICKNTGEVKMETDESGWFSVSVNGSMVEHVETGEDEDKIDSEDEEN